MAVYRIGNYLLANARKNCRFFFGDFFISAELNARERVFEIRLKKQIKVRDENGKVRIENINDYVEIESFKKYWGAQWRLMFSTDEEV